MHIVWKYNSLLSSQVLMTHCISFTRPNSYVYFPFGLGHRACIGKELAMVCLTPQIRVHETTLMKYELVAMLT